MRLGRQPRVHVHGQRVELREGVEGGQQQHHDAAALHSLHRAGQQVGRQRLEILRGNRNKKERRRSAVALQGLHIAGQGVWKGPFQEVWG